MGFTPQDILQVTFGPRCHSTIYCGFGNWSRVHFIFFTFVLWSLYMILLKYRNNKSKVCREPNQIGASFRTQSQWSCIRLVFHFSIYRSISAICAHCHIEQPKRSTEHKLRKWIDKWRSEIRNTMWTTTGT